MAPEHWRLKMRKKLKLLISGVSLVSLAVVIFFLASRPTFLEVIQDRARYEYDTATFGDFVRAMAGEHIEEVKGILAVHPEYIFDRDEQQGTALILAVLMESAQSAAILIDKGADVNAANEYGFTALHFAAAKRNIVLAKILVDHGAKVNIMTKDGYTPLDAVKAFSYDNKPRYQEFVDFLASKGAAFNFFR